MSASRRNNGSDLTNRRPQAADQQGARGRLSAGLDLQDGRGARRARCRRDHAGDDVLRATGAYRLGTHALPLLEARRPRPDGSASAASSTPATCFFYRGRAEARHRHAPGRRAPARPRRRRRASRFPASAAASFRTATGSRRRSRSRWQQGETLVAGIGQGYVLTTPLQLCTLAARIASGMRSRPRIVALARRTDAAAPVARTARVLGRSACRRARRHERGDQRARRHGLSAGASPSRQSRWRARPAPRRCAHHPGGTRHRRAHE